MRDRFSTNNPMKNPEQKLRMSEKNPMKDLQQRKRMSNLNPMKNKEVAKKVGLKHRKPIIIGSVEYSGLVEAANYYKLTIQAIYYWLKVGHTPTGEICKYKDVNMTISSQATEIN